MQVFLNDHSNAGSKGPPLKGRKLGFEVTKKELTGFLIGELMLNIA